MNPDFIISEKHTADGAVYIVLPTHISALNWLFARVTASERRQMSAHLDEGRYAQFQSDAAIAKLTFKHSSAAGLAPEKVQ
jgi:hypothetical protein